MTPIAAPTQFTMNEIATIIGKARAGLFSRAEKEL